MEKKQYKEKIMISPKAKIKWGQYLTRKDWRHPLGVYPLKSYRHVANGAVRRYKGQIPDGGWYKKIYDVQWTAL